ncbi:nuclear transport factor 2 family protein [Streptomyces sp. PU-14G]|uniref:nuclear transport factor 2 family protein n=1 Tax=Streptomyces sp. PU-14G TaxID=2800808 RepID=UPI0034DFE05D
MRPFDTTDPQGFLTAFFTAFHHDLVHGEEDTETVVDRYHTPDVVQFADGHRMDRGKLIAHTRPTRKHKPSLAVEIHDALADGDRIAARYTLHVHDRKRDLDVDVSFFGRFAPEGRLRSAHMLTRTRPLEQGGAA